MDWKIILILLVLLLPVAEAQVAIESVSSQPQKVLPGGEVVLNIEILNVGSARVNNILVSLDLTQLPFVPVDSSTEKIIERIRDDDSKVVSFRLRALPTATPEIYKIPVTLSYEGLKQTSLLSQEIIAAPRLTVLLDNSNIVSTGKQGDVNLKFVNNGLIPLTYLTATLRESPHYEIISSASVYIGDVDTADFETEKFSIVAKNIDPILVIDIQYRDQNNQEYRNTALVPLNVYTEEEAKQLGLIPAASPVWMIIFIVLIVLAIGYTIRRRRRKKHDH